MNEAKLNELLGKMVNELGAAWTGANVIIGDQLGLYQALAANRALTSNELAQTTGTSERYVREWLATQAASGYIEYDLVTFFDALHDMGDPVGAAAHVRTTLKPEGVWMIVEPNAQDNLAGNLNPVGRVYYAASTLVCVPASLSQEVGLALGAQAGETKLRQVVTAGGFTRFRRATETPFNMVLEVRP